MNRKAKMMFRWSLASSALIALFLVVYNLVVGYVPTAYCNTIIAGEVYMSRWWDILLGPIISFILLIMYNLKYDRSQDFDLKGAVILAFGFCMIAIMAIGRGTENALVTIWILGTLLCCFSGLCHVSFGWGMVLSCSMTLGVVGIAGASYGVLAGVIGGLLVAVSALGTFFGTIFLSHLLKWLSSRELWVGSSTNLRDWLMAR